MPRITIAVPEKTPQPYRFQLDRTTVTLGRGSENDVAIDCPSISVKHAEMVRVKGGYELRDIGSTNGMKLDGVRTDLIKLRNGQNVTLGDVAFEFLLTDEEMDALKLEQPAEEKPEPAAKDTRDPDSADSSAPVPRKVQPVVVAADGGGGGFLMVLLFLILSAAAFFTGMAVRYQKDTGSSLIDAIRNRGKVTAPAVKEVPRPAAK